MMTKTGSTDWPVYFNSIFKDKTATEIKKAGCIKHPAFKEYLMIGYNRQNP